MFQLYKDSKMSKIEKIQNIKPIEPILPGDKFVWKFDIECRSGRVIRKGSLAEVIEQSGMIPHNEIMERGFNLLIKTDGAVSIWSTFEQCFSRDLLEKI